MTCEKKECKESLGDTDEKRFFFDRVDKKEDTGCWEWVGGKDSKGYPVVNLKPGSCVAAWKQAYKIIRGEDTGSLVFAKTCKNKLCVNPDHRLNEMEKIRSRMSPQENGCILWTAAKDEDGYAIAWMDGKQGRLTRMLWEKEHGPIAPGLQICHKCDTPSCVNLAHFFLGSAKANSDDKRNKGRESRGETSNCNVLTDRLVILAREMRRNGATYPEIVKKLELSTSETNISWAVTGRTWKHINAVSPPVPKTK